MGKSKVDKLVEKRDVAGLVTLLQKTKKEEEQIACIRAVGALKDQQAIEPLLKALQDYPLPVTFEAADALGAIGDPAMDAVIGLLQDGNVFEQTSMAMVVGRVREPRAVEPLLQALTASDSWVRRPAAWALGMIGNALAVDPLIQRLTDSDIPTRWMAIGALGKIGDARARDSLTAIAADPNAPVIDVEELLMDGEMIGMEPVALEIGLTKLSLQEAAETALRRLG